MTEYDSHHESLSLGVLQYTSLSSASLSNQTSSTINTYDRKQGLILQSSTKNDPLTRDKNFGIPVGWNWTNSGSCRGMPALSAIAFPSPVHVCAEVHEK